MFWKTSGYFDTAAETNPLLHTWSLAVEVQLYLLFPILLLLTRRLSTWGIASLSGALAAASLVWATWECAKDGEAAYYLLRSRGWEILIGSLVACYMMHKGKSSEAAPSIRQFGSLLGFARNAGIVSAQKSRGQTDLP